ncbi:MAG: hypothetical protein ACI9BN_001018 [Francisella sp.]
MKIKTLIFVALIFSSVELYATSCNMVRYDNGYNGSVVFKCDDDISLKNNKLVFYMTGKSVGMEGISFDGVETDYSIEEIFQQIKKVSLNVHIKGWLDDQDFVAEKGKQISFKIKVARDSNPNYKILWGGVVKNSYKNYKSKANNIQLYKNETGRVYVLKKGLDCTIQDDCDSKIYIDENCGEKTNCKEVGQYFDLKGALGVVHQKRV